MKKRIFGIAVLLAVVAMCLTFAACPKPNDERSVTFVNELKNCAIDISIKGGPNVHLEGISSMSEPGKRETVTKKGEDITIMTVTFADSQVQANPSQFVILDGDLVAGKDKKGKDADGLSLSYGFLYFKGDQTVAGSPLVFKMDTLSLDN
jgi:hypothetical protein